MHVLNQASVIIQLQRIVRVMVVIGSLPVHQHVVNLTCHLRHCH
jgi:hypothetical protein